MLKAGFVLDGKYRILSVIGQGGMSTVYLAVHERLKQKWAVKEISMEYCENYEMISRKLIVEADILKRLDHPGLPKIVDIIEKKDAIWMVMEFIEGKTLKEILNERGRIEEKEILIWGKQLCEVLSYLHSKKPSIIYRDLKPENIILKKTGRLVLIDFGTAREYCYKNTACDAMYLGTKGYAAPEQYGGMGQTDARTDIYCLGVTLYSLLTGYNPEKPPYKIYPEKYWGEHISLEMKSLLLKCIQSEPEKRYQNCRELAYALSQIDYKKQKEKENERRKIIKFLIFMMVGQLSLMFCIGCKKVSFCYKEEAVVRYINIAEKSEDRESVEISLKKIDDRNVLKKEWSYERAESENTVQVQWDNIKKTENSDGIYYLQIKGQDKAGNKIKDDFKVVFRVNQRGADFILSHALKKKINKYYLKEAPKIKLREQCVKQTKSRAVILKDNEERKVIGESSITSSVIADKKSERYGWYEKYYNFAKKDFEREGDYRVTFQADTKEKELRFVVDKTPPVVHIGNLDKQIYEEKEHEFTIRVMDNYAFKELELYMETDRNILGQKGTKKIIIKPKDLDENYMVRKTLTADKRYQTVRYIARDKAGNVIDSNDNGDTKVCLVTDSKTVKEYQEHKKEYMLIGIISTLGIFIVISGSGLFIFTRRKRNLK